MISETFDLNVPIKEELRRGLVFNLKSRPAVGIFLSFYGYRHEVAQMMQTTSHATRAYYLNADGLQGFLKERDII